MTLENVDDMQYLAEIGVGTIREDIGEPCPNCLPVPQAHMRVILDTGSSDSMIFEMDAKVIFLKFSFYYSRVYYASLVTNQFQFQYVYFFSKCKVKLTTNSPSSSTATC